MVRFFEVMVSRILWLPRILALVGACAAAAAQAPAPSTPLTADQVITRVEAMNALRAEKLQGYSSVRTYRLEMRGLFPKEAEMVVRADYRAPDTKQFTVLSEKGSASVRNRIFRRLLQEELNSMAPKSQRKTAISLENYSFQIVKHYKTASSEFYVLQAEPKTSDKFLFAGRIWVDAGDFAVTKVDGQPAVNPSWWTKRTDFSRVYEHIGEFWLPQSNHSITKVRVFGTAILTITYRDYRITSSSAVAVAADRSRGASRTDLLGVAVRDAATAPYKSLARGPNPWTAPDAPRFLQARGARQSRVPAPADHSQDAFGFFRIWTTVPPPLNHTSSIIARISKMPRL